MVTAWHTVLENALAAAKTNSLVPQPEVAVQTVSLVGVANAVWSWVGQWWETLVFAVETRAADVEAGQVAAQPAPRTQTRRPRRSRPPYPY